MRKLLAPLAPVLLALLTMSMVAPDPVGAAPATVDTGSAEMTLVTRINELRASRGLAPLAPVGALFDGARAWSVLMATVGSISHNPALRALPAVAWTALGENVASNWDVQATHDALVNSPPHLANMVDPRFNGVGIGVVQTASGELFVTEVFMAATGAVAPVAAPAPTATAPAAQASPAPVAKAKAPVRRKVVRCRTRACRARAARR